MKHTALLLAGVCLLLVPSAQKYPLGKGNLRSGGGSIHPAGQSRCQDLPFYCKPQSGYFVLDELLLGFNMNYSGTFGPEQYTGTCGSVLRSGTIMLLTSHGFWLATSTTTWTGNERCLVVLQSWMIIPAYHIFGFDYFLTRRISCEGCCSIPITCIRMPST